MGNSKLDGRIPLDDVLAKAKVNTSRFIEQLEREEAGERIETVDSIQNQMKADKSNTTRKKLQFIDEMKNGLGKEIMDNKARGVVIKKPTLRDRIKKFFTNLYSKF